MATKAIKGSDIVEVGALDNFINDNKRLLELLEKEEVALKGVAKAAKEVAKSLGVSKGSGIREAKAANDALNKTLIEQERIKQAKIKTEKAEIQLNTIKQKAVEKEKAQQAQLNSAYSQLSKRLNDLRKSYKDLAAAGQENSAAARQQLKEIQQLDTKLKSIDGSVGQFQRNVGNYTNAFSKMTAAASKLGLTLSAAFVFRDTFETLKNYDEGLADVSKTTELTIEQADELSKSLLKIDTKTSVSALQELAVAAGRLGMRDQKDIFEFVEAADKVFVALGDDLGGSADEIATSLGKISALFGTEAKYGIGEGIERTGSAINHLAANSKASAEQILDFTNRLAGVAVQANISQSDVMALGALFGEAGQSIEVASTTLNVLLPKLATNQEHYAKVAGMTANEFAKMLQNAPIEALKAVAIGAKSSETGLVGLTDVLEGFGVESARATSIVGVLANSTDRLTELQKQSAQATKDNTSVQEEFNKKNQTIGAELNKLKKAWQEQVLGLNGATSASNTLKNAVIFLTKNLGTIIKIGIEAGKMWVAYKTTVLAVTVAEKAYNAALLIKENGLKSLIPNITSYTTATTTSTTATNTATASTKAFGLALKSIVFVAVIQGLMEMFNWLSKIDISAQAVEERMTGMNKEWAKNMGKSIKSATEKGILKEIEEIDKALKLSTDNTEEFNKQIQNFINNKKNDLILEINNLKKLVSNREQQVDLLKKSYDKTGNYNTGLAYGKATNELELYKVQLQGMYDIYEVLMNKQEEYDYNSKLENKINNQNKAFNTQISELTGLEKLKQELSILEKERSDYLVKTNDMEGEVYLKMTEQTKELQNQIKIYEDILKGEFNWVDRIEKFESTPRKAPTLGLQTEFKTEIETEKEEKEEEVETENHLKEILDIYEEFVKARMNQLDALEDAEKRKHDAAVTREQQLIQMREQGAANVEQSLTFEREAQAKALAEQEKIAKKKQRLELLNSALKVYANQVNSNDTNALGKTTGDISQLVAFINSLPTFWTGTKTDVASALGEPQLNGKDGYIVRVDGSEKILNPEQSRLTGQMTTDEIVKAAQWYRFGAYSDENISRLRQFNKQKESSNNDLILKKLTEIADKPVSNIGIETIANVVKMTEVVSKRNKTEQRIKHFRLGR